MRHVSARQTSQKDSSKDRPFVLQHSSLNATSVPKHTTWLSSLVPRRTTVRSRLKHFQPNITRTTLAISERRHRVILHSFQPHQLNNVKNPRATHQSSCINKARMSFGRTSGPHSPLTLASRRTHPPSFQQRTRKWRRYEGHYVLYTYIVPKKHITPS